MFFLQKKDGFTLVELLVVISIISILSVVGFASFKNIQSKARDARMKADVNAIKKAYEANYDPSLNGGQGGYKPLTAANFVGKQIPKQPNGNPYPCAVGLSVGTDLVCTTPSDQGFQISTLGLSDGSVYRVNSNQGTLATTVALCAGFNSLPVGQSQTCRLQSQNFSLVALSTTYIKCGELLNALEPGVSNLNCSATGGCNVLAKVKYYNSPDSSTSQGIAWIYNSDCNSFPNTTVVLN